jgi:hypothetical protein
MIWFLLETTNTQDREILIQHRKLRPATLITGATTRNGTKKIPQKAKQKWTCAGETGCGQRLLRESFIKLHLLLDQKLKPVLITVKNAAEERPIFLPFLRLMKSLAHLSARPGPALSKSGRDSTPPTRC